MMERNYFWRLMVLQAYEDALMEDREMTIICYDGGGYIHGWKHYPSMLRFPMA